MRSLLLLLVAAFASAADEDLRLADLLEKAGIPMYAWWSAPSAPLKFILNGSR